MTEATTKPLTALDVHRLFDYRDGVLYWRENQGCKPVGGKVAGCKRPHSWIVSINGRKHTRARLVIAWHTGNFPTYNAYHRNLDPFDDRIENLDDMPLMQANARKAEASGRLAGVTCKRGRYQAQIGASGYLGTFPTAEEAHEIFKHAHVVIHGAASPYSKTGDV